MIEKQPKLSTTELVKSSLMKYLRQNLPTVQACMSSLLILIIGTDPLISPILLAWRSWWK